jgi:hypothetical protein
MGSWGWTMCHDYFTGTKDYIKKGLNLFIHSFVISDEVK